MKKLNLEDVQAYVENNIGVFHDKRVERINGLKLRDLLKRKNPYLFKAKNVLTSEQIIRRLLDAHLSSNEETLFGDWLEKLAIFISGKVSDGYKSARKGVDLEFDRGNTRYIVEIKSGPKWGNSSQIAQMVTRFHAAKMEITSNNHEIAVVAVNGCCYGIENNPEKEGYFKYCGQRFWEFISGDSNLFVEIIEPLGHQAEARNDVFAEDYARTVNKFTRDFDRSFCKENGSIDWEKLLKFNSGSS